MTNPFDLPEPEERAVSEFMSRVAKLRIPEGGSRNAGSAELWCRARLLARWEAERRVQWPLDVMQPIEIAGGLVAAGLLLYLSLLA